MACRNCKPSKQPKPKPQPPKPKDKLPAVLLIAEDTEGARLWNWIYVGTSTCIATFERYAQVKMPGFNAKQVEELRDRLNTLLETHSARQNPTE